MDTLIAASSAGRRNTCLSAVIEFALDISRDHGARAAARFLDVHGAGFALIVRVLGEPQRRRRKLALLSGAVAARV